MSHGALICRMGEVEVWHIRGPPASRIRWRRTSTTTSPPDVSRPDMRSAQTCVLGSPATAVVYGLENRVYRVLPVDPVRYGCGTDQVGDAVQELVAFLGLDEA